MARKRRRMGLRLRKKDIKLARTKRFFNPKLKDYPDPAMVEERYRRYFVEDMGMEIVHKKSWDLWLTKATTVYYKQLRLGEDWEDKNIFQKAMTWVQEGVHPKQWRHYKRNKFRTRYLFWPRWRWAQEVPGYAETARWIVIHAKHNKWSDERLNRVLEEFITHVSNESLGSNRYALRVVHKGDRRYWTKKILWEVAREEMKA